MDINEKHIEAIVLDDDDTWGGLNGTSLVIDGKVYDLAALIADIPESLLEEHYIMPAREAFGDLFEDK